MAHVVSRGRQGPDELDNVVTKCEQCHLVEEHSGGSKIVPKKEIVN
jgi:5-methylcytosine-specific restriction endonuclease McrA